MKIYVNGEEKASGSQTMGVHGHLRPFAIGGFATEDSYNSGATMDVDCFGIWDRALNSAEITALYNGGAGLAYGDL
jgi:hypothetical protein